MPYLLKVLDLFGNPGGSGTICRSGHLAELLPPTAHHMCPDGKHQTSTFYEARAALCWPFGAVPNLYFAELFVPRTVCFDKVETFLLPLRRVPDLFPHLQWGQREFSVDLWEQQAMGWEHHLRAYGCQAVKLSLTGLRVGDTFFQALFLNHHDSLSYHILLIIHCRTFFQM